MTEEPVDAPTEAQTRRDRAVQRLLIELAYVADGHYPARALEAALEAVDVAWFPWLGEPEPAAPLRADQLDALLRAAARARVGALTHLPVSYPRARIDDGMRALNHRLGIASQERGTEGPAWRADPETEYHADVAELFCNDLRTLAKLDLYDRAPRAHRRARMLRVWGFDPVPGAADAGEQVPQRRGSLTPKSAA